MSSKIRIIVRLSGTKKGKSAIEELEKYYQAYCQLKPPAKKNPQWKYAVELFQEITKHKKLSSGSGIWVFRERARNPKEKSAYIKLCKTYGIGRNLRKKIEPRNVARPDIPDLRAVLREARNMVPPPPLEVPMNFAPPQVPEQGYNNNLNIDWNNPRIYNIR